jgi:hypothetical protein
MKSAGVLRVSSLVRRVAAAAVVSGLFATVARAQNTITITNPTSVDCWNAYDPVTVDWTYGGPSCHTGDPAQFGVVQIKMSLNGGQSFTQLLTTVSDTDATGAPVTSASFAIADYACMNPTGTTALQLIWTPYAGTGCGQATDASDPFCFVHRLDFHPIQLGVNNPSGSIQNGAIQLGVHAAAYGWPGDTVLILPSLTGASSTIAVSPTCTLQLDWDFATYVFVANPAYSVATVDSCGNGVPANVDLPQNANLLNLPIWYSGITVDPQTGFVSACGTTTAYNVY